MCKNSENPLENEQNDDIECEFNKLRSNNANNIIEIRLNINSLPGNFDQLKLLIMNQIGILSLTYTELDEIFPSSRFLADGFSRPFRLIEIEMVMVF